MKQPSDTYTKELNPEPRQQPDGERAAWLADNIFTDFEVNNPKVLEVVALLRKYSELERKAALLSGLRELCGHIECGEGDSVTICQDDATGWWSLRIGAFSTERKTPSYSDNTFNGVIQHAISARISDE